MTQNVSYSHPQLFFDLVFVAAEFKMGGVIKSDFETGNMWTQFILFAHLWGLWFHLERYMCVLRLRLRLRL